MTLSRQPDRYIDVITCNGGCGAVVTETANKTVHENAGRFGWEQVGDKDFCKHCKSKTKKEARKP